MQSWHFLVNRGNINHALEPIKNELPWRKKCGEVKREKRKCDDEYIG